MLLAGYEGLKIYLFIQDSWGDAKSKNMMETLQLQTDLYQQFSSIDGDIFAD